MLSLGMCRTAFTMESFRLVNQHRKSPHRARRHPLSSQSAYVDASPLAGIAGDQSLLSMGKLFDKCLAQLLCTSPSFPSAAPEFL